MTESIYSFERTELRVLQAQCGDDNELFLNLVADMIGKREQKIRELEARISYDSWTNNPDRMGGQFTEEEIGRAGEWR